MSSSERSTSALVGQAVIPAQSLARGGSPSQNQANGLVSSRQLKGNRCASFSKSRCSVRRVTRIPFSSSRLASVAVSTNFGAGGIAASRTRWRASASVLTVDEDTCDADACSSSGHLSRKPTSQRSFVAETRHRPSERRPCMSSALDTDPSSPPRTARCAERSVRIAVAHSCGEFGRHVGWTTAGLSLASAKRGESAGAVSRPSPTLRVRRRAA